MKTIVYLISTLHRTGPTNVLAGIVKNLDKTKFCPVIVTLSPEPNEKNSWWSELKANGVEIYSLNLTRWQGVFVAKHLLKQLLARIKPDIIHAHCFRSALLASRLNACKTIATVHCDYEIDFKMTYGDAVGTLMGFLFTRALKRMNVRVACSKMLADLLNKKYPFMRFEGVNNGVDTDKFHPVADKDALRRQLGLPLDKKIVVWAGSFIPRKDPLTMARAILQLSDEPYYFVFCGTGPLEQACKELLKERHNVLFTGFITNIEKYYQAADIYVATSKSEGLPLAVLEAQFCGLVPLLSDIPQHRYILSQKQEQKCLFENNVQDLIIHLKALLNADNTALLQIGTEHVQQFAAKNMTQQYQHIYKDLLS